MIFEEQGIEAVVKENLTEGIKAYYNLYKLTKDNQYLDRYMELIIGYNGLMLTK